MGFEFSDKSYDINEKTGAFVEVPVDKESKSTESTVDRTIQNLAALLSAETALSQLPSEKIDHIISLANVCKGKVSATSIMGTTIEKVLGTLEGIKTTAIGRERETNGMTEAVAHAPAVQAAPREQMVQDVVRTLNDTLSGENVPSALQAGMLVTGKEIQKRAVAAPQTTAELLLKAAAIYDSPTMQKTVKALPNKEARGAVKALLQSLAKKGDLAEYCFAFSEIVKLAPHLTQSEYRQAPLPAEAIQSRLTKVIAGWTANVIEDPKTIPSMSLKAFFSAVKEREKEDTSLIIKLLQSWVNEKNHELYIEALSELSTLYTPKEFYKIVISTVSPLLASIVKKGDPELYCGILGKLSTLYPDIGRFILGDEAGVPQPASIQLAIKQLQSKGIIANDLPSDLLKSLKGAEADEAAGKLLKALAKIVDHPLYSFAIGELIKLNADIGKFVTNLGSLTLKGIEAVIEDLRKRGNIPSDLPYFLYDTMDTCAEDLKKKITDPSSTRFSAVVKHPGSSHVTPIYFEKCGEKWKALVTDSTGGTYDYGVAALRMLHKALPEDKVGLYFLSTRRQYSLVGCPIFAILDIAQFSKNPHLMESVNGSFRGVRESDDPTNTKHFRTLSVYHTDLPPAMMRPMQSLSEIAKHVEELEKGLRYAEEELRKNETTSYKERDQYRKNEAEEKLRKGKALEATVRKRVVTVVTAKGTSQQNVFARQLFCKYSHRLVGNALQAAARAPQP